MKLKDIFLCIASIAMVCIIATCGSAPKPEQDAAQPEAEEEEIIEEDPEIIASYERMPISDEPIPFTESWGYVWAGRENELKADFPLTDVAVCFAEIDGYGNLTDIPKRSKIKNFNGRVHLVAACSGRALTHFSIDPEYSVRQRIIRQLLEASKDFDGLQIDFENVPAKDGAHFVSFLKELKEGLNGKPLSIAIAARTRTLQNDVYDYATIEPIVDRMLIMAYDEHWSTSKAGPIASTAWCKRIADYAKTKIPPEKLIMGMPFYGRSWSDKNPAGAWYYSRVNRIYSENDTSEIKRDAGVPYFTYSTTVNVTTYFDDEYSLFIKCRMYKDLGIDKIGFWRVGHEDPEFWKHIRIE